MSPVMRLAEDSWNARAVLLTPEPILHAPTAAPKQRGTRYRTERYLSLMEALTDLSLSDQELADLIREIADVIEEVEE